MKITRIVSAQEPVFFFLSPWLTPTNVWPCPQLAMEHMCWVLLILSGSSAGEFLIVIFQFKKRRRRKGIPTTIVGKDQTENVTNILVSFVDLKGDRFLPVGGIQFHFTPADANDAAKWANKTQTQGRIPIARSLHAPARAFRLLSWRFQKAIHRNRRDVKFFEKRKKKS